MNNENLQELFTLLDTLPNPVTLNELVYDEDGEAYDKIIYVNKSFIKTIGYTIEDIPDDRTWFSKAYPEKNYQEYIFSEWSNAVEQAKQNKSDLNGFPAKVHCKDRKERWFNITTQLNHPIRDKYRTIVFVQTDTPEQTKLELDEKSLELIQERHLNKTILDIAPIRIFWKDMDGVYLGCNRAFLDDASLDNESDIIGKTDYDMVWKDEAESYREDDKRVRETGIDKLHYIETQPQADGKRITLATSKVPLKDKSGNICGVVGIYQDITEEFEAKEALREQEKVLLIQSRQAAMGEMISMIAHQWRQPLSNISAVLSHLQIQNMLGKSVDEEIVEHAEAMSTQVQYLSQTISDFRNFFKQDKEKEEILAGEAVEQALDIIGKLLHNSEIELRSSFLSQTRFSTHAKELQQVCINLIKNAADILIEKDIEKRWIDISTYDDKDSIVIEVSDNGRGIDKDIMDNIFEPYFSTKDEKHGTGLGLYMCKTIVEKHLKGKISCYNKDEGALFKIELPMKNI